MSKEEWEHGSGLAACCRYRPRVLRRDLSPEAEKEREAREVQKPSERL